MTEAQGGMTCLRPPCEEGEKQVPLCRGALVELPWVGSGSSEGWWRGWCFSASGTLASVSPVLLDIADSRPGGHGSVPANQALSMFSWTLPV